MWKTLYAIGLALPRILFRPLREFQLVIPSDRTPFIQELATEMSALSPLEAELGEKFKPLLAEVNRLKTELTAVTANIEEVVSMFDKPLGKQSDVLFDIIRTAEKYNIDLVEFIKLQELEYALREKDASQKHH